MKKFKIYLIAHDIRSVANVGALFRIADTAGIEKVYCTGITATPIDRFGRKRKDFTKVSLGAEESVAWEKSEGEDLIKKLKKGGVKIIALEQSERSTDYKKIKIEEDTVIIVGNEVKGLSNEILNMTDEIAEIPLLGTKESLNVSVAAGILIFRLLDI